MAAKRIGWVNVLARVLAATIGAYGVCYLWIVALVLLLPRHTSLDGVDATIVSTLTSFLVFVAIVLRTFAMRSIVRVWAEVVAFCIPPLALIGWVSP